MRIVKKDENSHNDILGAAAKTGSQIRRMQDHEASLEDLFIVIMEKLGYSIKSSSDLLASGPSARKVDAPLEMKEAGI